MVHLWATSEGWVLPLLGSQGTVLLCSVLSVHMSTLWPILSLEDLQGDGGVLDGSNDTTVVQVQYVVLFLKDL